MNVARARLILGLMWLAATLSLMPGEGLAGPAEGQSREVETLLKDLAGQLGTPKGDQGTRANNAAWEDTAAFLKQRFGSEDKERLPPKAASTKETSTWKTSILKGDHFRDIRATWDRGKGKLKVQVLGNAHGQPIGQQQKERVGPYLVLIQADVVEEKDEKGNPILRARLPDEGATLSLAVGCDERNPVGLNGEWKDNQGRKWVIEHPSFSCAERLGPITLTCTNSRGYKVEHKGDITNWQITAKHTIVDADAIEEPPQDWLRQEIASGKKGRGIFEISLFPQFARDGTLSLEGTYTGYNVKWSPAEKVVRSVEPSHEKPLVLSQALKTDQSRIARVEVPPPSPPLAEKPPECPPEVWQSWEKKKNETREIYKKLMDQKREEYKTRMRDADQRAKNDIEKYGKGSAIGKIAIKVYHGSIERLTREMEEQLARYNKLMQKELAQLEQKQKECASPTGEPAPPKGPPLAEKPKKCPDEVQQYWLDKIMESLRERDRVLGKISEDRMKRDMEILAEDKEQKKQCDAILDVWKTADAEDKSYFLDLYINKMNTTRKVTDDKLAASARQFETEHRRVYFWYNDVFDDYASSLRNCQKP